MIAELGIFMRISSFLLLSSTLLFNAACVSPTPPASVETKSPPVIKEDFSKILEVSFRGQLTLGDGKAYFQACGDGKELPVEVDTGLKNIYEQISATKFTPMYVEFVGEITFPKIKDTQSDALMRIDRVHHMALAKTSLQCAKPTTNFLFKAKGEEPYWRLTLNENKLIFATKGSNRVLELQNANFETTQINRIKTTNKKGERLSLIILPGHCYNLNMQEYWGYITEVDSISGKFSGCGEPGWPATDFNFSGYYLNTTPDKTINLTLNENYSVVYKEKTGTEVINKTGFWKSNSPERVVVMLTRQGKQNIREEVIFERSGLTLNAATLNKDNIVFDIPESEGLFNKMNHKEISEKNTVNRIDREFPAEQIVPGLQLDRSVQQAVNQYFKMHRTDPKNTKFSSVNYDLNGDGIKDAIVFLDWCSKSGCEMLIFEGKDGGYRFASRVSQVKAPIVISHNQHYLWQSLLIEKNKQWLMLDFDGISYPGDSNKLQPVNQQDHATGVVLFGQGTPFNWFPITIR